MTTRVKTAKVTEEILNDLERRMHLGRNILARYAIVLSLKNPEEQIKYTRDKQGFELNRSTLTGDYDSIFKGLITVFLKENISDSKFLDEMKKHCDRGSILLKNIYDFEGNKEKTIKKLINCN